MRKPLLTAFLSLALWCSTVLYSPVEAAATYSLQRYPYADSGLKGRTVVLDPGHGGSDTGAIGASGLKEKDVTLSIAQDLRGMLEKTGAKVILTRKSDRDVSGTDTSDVRELQARADIANRSKADLFISIHADAFDDPSVGGTTTYFFPKTALDVEFASDLQQQLAGSVGLTDRGYLRNDFFVLDHTIMPSALVEVAFISNSAEEKMLKSKSFQKKAAQGIFNGILAYFN